MIKEDYVSFEIANLLKEKGFEIPYDSLRGVYINGIFKRLNPGGAYLYNLGDEIVDVCSLQMAMKWLREVHNINLSVVPHSYKEDKPFDYEFAYWNGGEYHTPYDEKHPTYHELFGKSWKKYEEACEAAIKYCLENLI